MSGAARAKAYRERQKSGIVLLTVAVDEVALVDKLVEVGLLDSVTDDQEAITRAAEKVLEYFSENSKCP